jgi:ANTAR domain
VAAMSREERLAETFVELADTLVADFDVIDFLQVLAARCAELLDVAAIGILQQRTIRHGEVAAAQLQAALTSRVVIEQAKGVLAERLQVSPDEAFGVLRTAARSRGRLLSEVAAQVAGSAASVADIGQLLGPSAAELSERG